MLLTLVVSSMTWLSEIWKYILELELVIKEDESVIHTEALCTTK